MVKIRGLSPQPAICRDCDLLLYDHDGKKVCHNCGQIVVYDKEAEAMIMRILADPRVPEKPKSRYQRRQENKSAQGGLL